MHSWYLICGRTLGPEAVHVPRGPTKTLLDLVGSTASFPRSCAAPKLIAMSVVSHRRGRVPYSDEGACKVRDKNPIR